MLYVHFISLSIDKSENQSSQPPTLSRTLSQPTPTDTPNDGVEPMQIEPDVKPQVMTGGEGRTPDTPITDTKKPPITPSSSVPPLNSGIKFK